MTTDQPIQERYAALQRQHDRLTAERDEYGRALQVANRERDQLASRLDELIEARIELSEAGHLPPAPFPGSSRRVPEAEPTGVHAWSETAGLSVVVVACTRCGIVQRRDGASRPCRGPGRIELRAQEPEPTDDELAAEIDRAQEEVEAEAQAHAQGYAEAVARLRDDDRYRNWWSPRNDKPTRNIRLHLADYLETVGPDGVDVETCRWQAREQAVIRAAIAWRNGEEVDRIGVDDLGLALIEAVDALPHAERLAATEPEQAVNLGPTRRLSPETRARMLAQGAADAETARVAAQIAALNPFACNRRACFCGDHRG